MTNKAQGFKFICRKMSKKTQIHTITKYLHYDARTWKNDIEILQTLSKSKAKH